MGLTVSPEWSQKMEPNLTRMAHHSSAASPHKFGSRPFANEEDDSALLTFKDKHSGTTPNDVTLRTEHFGHRYERNKKLRTGFLALITTNGARTLLVFR